MEPAPLSLTIIEQSLCELIEHVERFAAQKERFLETSHPQHRHSTLNLLHYLALRQLDIRPLQQQLAHLGLSSLSHIEEHTLPSLKAALRALKALGSSSPQVTLASLEPLPMGELSRNSRRLFGERPDRHHARIMVTMPSSSADDPGVIFALLAAGMNVMRINCAHDSPVQWHRMIDHLHQAEARLDRKCKIYMDLAGPKLRTGQLPPCGQIYRVKVARDARGNCPRPRPIQLVTSQVPTQGTPALPLPGAFLATLEVGDCLKLRDCRNRKRRLHLVEAGDSQIMASCSRTTYFETGQRLLQYRDGELIGEARVGELPTCYRTLSLVQGQLLDLLPPGCSDPVEPGVAAISCTLPDVFESVRPGQAIRFDDGKIEGVIEQCSPDFVRVRITRTAPGGSQLAGDKGINLPQTRLSMSALTQKDLLDLEQLAHRVDMVGLSFVRHPKDLHQLEQALTEIGAEHLGIILKIENQLAVQNLGRLLLAGLQRPAMGVMVARGDLAAEVGFDRLAEVQEQVLWLCQAAHVPVIWATQVLENLAKKGAPSRAEISDTVMAARAECVMLNKGENIVGTVAFLADILGRMEAHQRKKSARLRPLRISQIEGED